MCGSKPSYTLSMCYCHKRHWLRVTSMGTHWQCIIVSLFLPVGTGLSKSSHTVAKCRHEPSHRKSVVACSVLYQSCLLSRPVLPAGKFAIKCPALYWWCYFCKLIDMLSFSNCHEALLHSFLELYMWQAYLLTQTLLLQAKVHTANHCKPKYTLRIIWHSHDSNVSFPNSHKSAVSVEWSSHKLAIVLS